jgi:uncharacterized protein YkwD
MALAPALLTPESPRHALRASHRLAGLLVVAFAASSFGLLAAPRQADAWSSGQFSSASERLLVSLTNQSRASAGLRALKVDSTLTSIARWRSKDMITRNYFSHNIPPAGYNVFHVLDQKHYCYVIAGENIGWNNYPDDVATQVVHNSFMQSPGHRSNILNRRWDVIGVGAYKGPTGKKMWTVIFADKCGSSGSSGGGGGGSKATPKPKPQPKPAVKAPATPRPTPKPTPKPTPVKTMPPPPSDPPGLVLGPGAPFGDFATQPADGGPPPGVPTSANSPLRVVDPAPPGLLETIVGGVTGFYLGG